MLPKSFYVINSVFKIIKKNVLFFNKRFINKNEKRYISKLMHKEVKSSTRNNPINLNKKDLSVVIDRTLDFLIRK